MIVPGMFVCSSFLISVCMFIVSKALLISSATVIVRARGAIWLNPFATVLFSVCSAVTVECCVLYPQGFGWYILGTTERNNTNDIQVGGEIDHKLCCTCLEHKPMRHQLHKFPIQAEDFHRMSSVDHLHAEANVLKVREHSELLSTQYLARCL